MVENDRRNAKPHIFVITSRRLVRTRFPPLAFIHQTNNGIGLLFFSRAVSRKFAPKYYPNGRRRLNSCASSFCWGRTMRQFFAHLTFRHSQYIHSNFLLPKTLRPPDTTTLIYSALFTSFPLIFLFNTETSK